MSTFIKNSTKVINDSVKLVRKTEKQFNKNQCLEKSRTNFLKEDKICEKSKIAQKENLTDSQEKQKSKE